eukprot:TRINITY_DN44014_c0_g1_i1.p1 TRINITY_DN44014_c0_g1~~TRINITY_DN44014_c0_g1_i1.p1  ORF type:complete len:689 (-),score=87.33 TRINITY_DN44014_c0_g1_i1:30-2060(-)
MGNAACLKREGDAEVGKQGPPRRPQEPESGTSPNDSGRHARFESLDVQQLKSCTVSSRRYTSTDCFHDASVFDCLLRKFWPALRGFIENNILMGIVEPTLKRVISSRACFDSCSLGEVPPRILGAKTHTSDDNDSEDSVELAMSIVFESSDVDVSVCIAPGIRATLTRLQIEGTWCFQLRNLSPEVPLMSGITLYFMNAPEVSAKFGGVLRAFEGRFVQVQKILEEQIANVLVVPNRVALHLSPTLSYYELRYPEPEGILEVRILHMKMQRTSDGPRAWNLVRRATSAQVSVRLRLGATSLCSEKADLTSEGTFTWKQSLAFSFIVDASHGQSLVVESQHEQPGLIGRNTLSLGGAKISVANVISASSKKPGKDTFEITLKGESDDQLMSQFSNPELSLRFRFRPFFAGGTLAEAHDIEPLGDECRGILVVVIDALRDLEGSLEGAVVEVAVRVGCEKQTTWSRKTKRFEPADAGDHMEERLQYLLTGYRDTTKSHETDGSDEEGSIGASAGQEDSSCRRPPMSPEDVAWLFRLQPSLVGAIARGSIGAEFGQALRLPVKRPLLETLILDVVRTSSPDQSLYRGMVPFQKILSRPGWTLPLEEWPLDQIDSTLKPSCPKLLMRVAFVAIESSASSARPFDRAISMRKRFETESVEDPQSLFEHLPSRRRSRRPTIE